MKKVLVVDDDAESYKSFLEPRFQEIEFTFLDDPKDVEPYLIDTEVLISMCRWLEPEMVAGMKKLKWLQCTITGTDHLHEALSNSQEVILTSGRGIHGPQMTEITLLHMLALYRQINRLSKNQGKHIWDRFLPKVLDTRKVAILGLGSIAEHMAGCFKALGMSVSGISRSSRDVDGIEKVYPREQILEAVSDIDFLVILVPLSVDTEKIIDAQVFDAMKDTACIINVARGGVVDEAALIDALREEKIAGAGLDVFENRPLEPNSPLWDMQNVFITPHVGGRSDLYTKNILEIIEPNLRYYCLQAYDKMTNIVDLSGIVSKDRN